MNRKLNVNAVRYLIIFLLSSCSAQGQISEKKLHKSLRSAKSVLIENEAIAGLDFTDIFENYQVGKDLYEGTADVSITFKNCVFEGPLVGYNLAEDGTRTTLAFRSNLSFLDCIFQEEVILKGIHVLGRVDFSGSNFHKTVNLQQATFSHHANFSRCSFRGRLLAHQMVANHQLSFFDVKFEQDTYFQQAYFRMDADFDLSTFSEYADFSLVNADQNITFNDAYFSKRSNFGNARLRGTASFSNAKFKDIVNFRGTQFFEAPEFSDTQFRVQPQLQKPIFQDN